MTAQSAVVDFERNAVFLRLIDCFEVVCIFKALKSEKNAIFYNIQMCRLVEKTEPYKQKVVLD